MHESDAESGGGPIRPFGMLVSMGLYVLAGAPLLFLVWRFLNEALAGEVRAGSALLAVVGLAGLLALLVVVARQIRRWEEA